jgi:hypothetical protein
MLVLIGVFNTRILDATNYANEDYTLIVVYTMLKCLFTETEFSVDLIR